MTTEEIKAMLEALDGLLAPLLEGASFDEIEVKITAPDATFEANYDSEKENWLVTIS